jgi:benzoyl-CoA reductase/2-hydroxyglutaryl-CoA dehydratase subunit BcrC/BadD/HgdB
MMTSKAEQIRTLNDRLRQNLGTGVETAVITTGVAALGDEAVARIVKTIAVYDDFCHENDPYEEHDFGAFEAEGQVIFFKIDYFDKTLTCHSPDAADRSVTERVITIMLAEEY